MRTVGITGGIGMGKSAAARLLQAAGTSVVDTDELARLVVAPGSEALREIASAFGTEFIDSMGALRRKELAAVVFSDSAKRSHLESITHPRITALWRQQLEAWRTAGRSVGVVVIPLLFETGVAVEFDLTICVACLESTQRDRLLARGWTPSEVQQRCAAQLPVMEKMSRSDHVVWTEGELISTQQQLVRIIAD